ncbi:hypothetical protein C0991_007712 [Blastosporella zonata]|nr:hypothetical protein C0991_007712 [Blastosporella zonata]
MALSVSGFPEPLRQLDADDSSLKPLQRGLSLFAKRRQNTDNTFTDSAVDPSPISNIDEFAQMAILQPPIIPPSLAQRPRQISLTRRTPPPQRQPSLGRLEIGSLPSRPSLPKPPTAVVQTPIEQQSTMAHPRPLPALPSPVSQGPIIESSKSAAIRAAAAAQTAVQPQPQPQPRPPPSRVILAGPSRPRAQTTVPQAVGVRYQSMAVEPTESSGVSVPASPPAPTLPPTPQTAYSATNIPGPSGPRPLPRIPPVSVAPQIASPAPIPAAPQSAAVLSSQFQPPYVPTYPGIKRPKTSPSSSAAFGGVFDALPSSWASRPVDLNPTGPSGSGSGSASASSSNAHASGSGSNAHASGSGSNAHASGLGSNAHASASGSNAHASGSGTPSSARSLPRPRSHSRSHDRNAEASGSRSRGAASPIPYALLASGSNSAPLPSSSGSASGSGLGGTTTPPGSRRASSNSNPPTPRSSATPGHIANTNRSPKASPRIPSLPPPKFTTRAVASNTKIVEESAITSVSAITITTRPSPTSSAARSHSVGHPTSILKNSKSRTTKRALTLHNAPPEPSSPRPKKDTDMDVDNAGADVDMGLTISGPGNSGPLLSRSPSPIRYARSSSMDTLLDSDDDAHPNARSRPRSRSQLRAFRRSYRPKPIERSPSPIAYAKRSLVEPGGMEPGMLFDDEDGEEDMEFGLSPKRKQRRHTQPRSYQFDFRGPVDDGEKERAWDDVGGRKDSKDSKDSKETKENKEGGGAWDTVWKNAVGSNRVRKHSKSKASQTASKDSGSGTGTPVGSVIDISNPKAIHSTTTYTREFTPNYFDSSLRSRESEDHSVTSHDSSEKGSSRPGSAKKPRRPLLPPSIPPTLSPISSVRTRTTSDVSQQQQRHARTESEGGHSYKTRLSGVLPGVSWGAEVNTEKWGDMKRLTPQRRAEFDPTEVEQRI